MRAHGRPPAVACSQADPYQVCALEHPRSSGTSASTSTCASSVGMALHRCTHTVATPGASEVQGPLRGQGDTEASRHTTVDRAVAPRAASQSCSQQVNITRRTTRGGLECALGSWAAQSFTLSTSQSERISE